MLTCSAVEQFIRAKYERKQYIAKGDVPASKEQSTNKEPSQEQKTKSKSKRAPAASSNANKSSGQSNQVSGLQQVLV